MGWLTKVIVAVTLQYISQTCGVPSRFSLEAIDRNYQHSRTRRLPDLNIDLNAFELTTEEDAHLKKLGRYLLEMLLLPKSEKGLPLVYMDDKAEDEIEPVLRSLFDKDDNYDGEDYEQDFEQTPQKRSRYYRQYPWKRQSTMETYDSENRYLCQPNKDDVYRLLVALHDARRGSRGRSIDFCNRKRPANKIFTHVRFLG